MPALTFIGRLSALSLLVVFPAAPHAQPAVAASQPPHSNLAAAAPASAPFDTPVPASPPAATAQQEADLLMVHQRYQAAIEAYSKIEQPSAAVWNRMGIAYQMLFDTKNATRCYKESLKIDPNHSGALNNLATLEDSRKNFAAAERLYRQALKINPNSARTLKNLGTNLALQHRYSESSEVYSQALALDPQIMDKFSGPTAEARAPLRDRGQANYLSARTCARAGLNACAIEHLRHAFDEGYATTKQVANDEDFEGLRGKPEFERLLAEQQ
jgi:tetratricopeptide (TPR) repeat protein